MKSLRKAAIARQRSFEERLAERLRSRKVADARLRARQAQGKIRRFLNTNFRKQEMVAALALRRGECNRCGACCELLFKCRFSRRIPMARAFAAFTKTDQTLAAFFQLKSATSRNYTDLVVTISSRSQSD